ncbi:MAG: hypothetical protein EXR99_13310 [Gemmataceae bacterium]|nr:hypothetical protein [Gemmataceae bacterium]
MDNWRFIFRQGIAPLLSHSSLVALKKGLREDDPALLQDCVVFPRANPLAWDLPASACGFFGYCGKEGEGLVTVYEIEQFHERLCLEVEWRLGWPGAARVFLDWCDTTTRSAMRRNLFLEIKREQSQRWQRSSQAWRENQPTGSPS